MALNTLLALPDRLAERGGFFWLRAFEINHEQDALFITLAVAEPKRNGELAEKQRWRIDCQGIGQDRSGPSYKLSEDSREFSRLSIVQDHALLYSHNDIRYELNISAQPRDVAELLVDLIIAHERVVEGHIPFFEYLSARTFEKLRTLLSSGSGQFAYAPLPLAEAYLDVLQSHGSKPALFAEKNGFFSQSTTVDRLPRHHPATDRASALLFGNGHVVASAFRAARTM